MSRWSWTLEKNESERADLLITRAIERGHGSWKGDATAVSRSQIKRLIDEGAVTADGQPIRAGTKLRASQRIEVRFEAPTKLDLEPEDRPIEILYEDEHLLILNKPPGLTVHPSETQAKGTLVHALLHHVKDLSGIGGKLRPGIVHRIDKDTSGALAITKNDAAHRALSEIFAKHEIERAYWALCYGSPTSAGPTRIETLIGRNPKDRKKMSADVKTGRKAVTWVKRLEEYSAPRSKPFASWVEARLETGRTHQVRVHLTAEGHSVMGDPVYGVPSSKHSKWLALPADVRDAVECLPGQALHARVLGFKHPISGKAIRVEAPPPPAFEALMKALGRYK